MTTPGGLKASVAAAERIAEREAKKAKVKKAKTRAKVRKPSVAAYRETPEDETKRWEEAGKKHNDGTGMNEHMARVEANRRVSRFHVNAGGIRGHIQADAEADTMHVTVTSQDGTELQIDWNEAVGGFDVRAVRTAGSEFASCLEIVPLSGNLVCLRARLAAGKDEG